MMTIFRRKFLFAALLAAISGSASAQYLDVIGVSALRSITTNLNGAGIRVGQPEANNGTNNFEVNPAAVNAPVSLFTYYSASGTSTTFPNSLSGESTHGDAVGQTFYGPGTGVATNVAHVDNFDADYYVQLGYSISGFTTNWVCSLVGAVASDRIVNQSFIFGAVPSQIPVAAQQAIDQAYDNYTATNATLFVSGAGNGGGVSVCPPSTCYNGISVGVYDGGSSDGPTVDNGRCKPDLVAFGVFTSFSTPMVSGAATLLLQAGLRGDGGSGTNFAADTRTIKALLINGAVKPLGWTNGNATPLDARYGAGVLNILNSYEQLAGGRQGSIVSNLVAAGAAHPPTGSTGTVAVLSGWDFGTNTSGRSPALDAIKHYYFNVSNAVATAKFSATATLVWNRHVNTSAINNLALYLYDCANSNLVTCSTSLVDNVQHLYQTNLPAGRYDLQVWKAGGLTVTTNEAYALAFAFVPPPVLAIAGGTNSTLTWPVYPAGFAVQGATNLISPMWSTNDFSPPAFSNQLNLLRFNPTNAAQFFRLQSPDF